MSGASADDIDVAIRGDAITVAALIKALANHEIVPRITDAAQLARDSMVLLVRHRPTGVDFDLSLAWTSFEHEAIDEATATKFGAVSAPMARPEDLVVFKAVAGRGKDLDDLSALLALYPKLDLARIRDRIRELAALADSPDMAAGLEAAITASKKTPAMQSSPSRRKTSKSTQKRKTS